MIRPLDDHPDDRSCWQHRLFEGTCAEALESFGRIFVQRTYPAKTVLFAQGDDAQVVYLVKRGKIRIARSTDDGKEVTLSILGCGDIFGQEVAFSEETMRTVQATVIEESVLLLTRRHELVELVTGSPNLALNMFRYLEEKRQEAILAIEELVSLRVRDRIKNLLNRLAREHATETRGGLRIDFRLTHGEIACLVGSTRETVSVELGRLRRSGVFTVINGHFVLPRGAAHAAREPVAFLTERYPASTVP